MELVGEVFKGGERMRRAADDTAATILATITNQMHSLRRDLWTIPLTESEAAVPGDRAGVRGTGHLREFAVPGEPDLPPGFRYEPTPLSMPSVPIDIDFATQGLLGNCYLISAINGAAQWEWDPDAIAAMVMEDPDDENFVIVTVHGGTYRLPATLPVDEKTGQLAFATSPDGSTAVCYLEKAAAAHFGSWKDLEAGEPIYPLYWLVGDRYSMYRAEAAIKMSDADIRAVMTAERPTFVTVPAEDTDEGRASVMSGLNLVEGHGYTVHRDHPSTGYKLHNPWRRLHPNSLEPRDLRALGAGLYWAEHDPERNPVPVAKEDVNT